ncbi:MAG: diguanylate cyclase [Lentisphaerae bacterium]|nr:diguanylate cyclase [Lentisphaerota bacterium]
MVLKEYILDWVQRAQKIAHLGIWDQDPVSNKLWWSDETFRILGLEPQSIAPSFEKFLQVVHPDDRELIVKQTELALDSNDNPYKIDYRIVRPDGSERIIHEEAVIERDEKGSPMKITGIIQDITERKQTEKALFHQKQRLSYILEGTNVATWEWNIQTGETIFNERWAEIIGYTLEELAPISIDTWMKFCHPDDLKKSEELLNKHFAGKLDFYECEARMRHKNGNWIWILDKGRIATWTNDGKPLLICGTHQDITERKQSEERIQHIALHDNLTGLPNRNLFFDRLNYAIFHAGRYQHSVALLYIDIDGFKPVNDTFGHYIGDKVLKKIAKRIKSCIRDTDTAARLGGDEFAVILQDIQQREFASIVAKKIIKSIANPIIIKTKRCILGASIGISTYAHDATKPDVMLQQADIAMYNVKRMGKNNYLFYEFSKFTLDKGV